MKAWDKRFATAFHFNVCWRCEVGEKELIRYDLLSAKDINYGKFYGHDVKVSVQEKSDLSWPYQFEAEIKVGMWGGEGYGTMVTFTHHFQGSEAARRWAEDVLLYKKWNKILKHADKLYDLDYEY